VRRPLVTIFLIVACLGLASCQPDDNPANPTPAPFDVLLQVLQVNGIRVSSVVSGEPGCNDQALARTAVSFLAQGFDQATPTRIYLYGFKNRATFDRLLPAVDACAKAYATDPATFGSIQVSPFVANGPGPWGTQFTDRLRDALTKAAGNGG
jgi:hypothetical protein